MAEQKGNGGANLQVGSKHAASVLFFIRLSRTTRTSAEKGGVKAFVDGYSKWRELT